MSNIGKLTVRASTGLIVIVGVLAVVVGQGNAAGTAPPSGQGPDANVAGASAGAFSVLNRNPLALDQSNEAIRDAAQHDPELLPSQARVLNRDSQTTTWLVPAGGGKLCLALQPGDKYTAVERSNGQEHASLTYVCNDTQAVITNGLALRTYGDIVGLVPDDVNAVNADIDGSESTVPVSNNIYKAHTSSSGFELGSASYQLADGTSVTSRLP